MTVVTPTVASATGVVYLVDVPVPAPGVEPSVVYQIVAPEVVVEMATVVAVP
jgi:hypothetical protein